tara:strand:+ start:253 stop:570 length:318 start_codon:yes stop_codon:yes gene_type:complete
MWKYRIENSGTLNGELQWSTKTGLVGTPKTLDYFHKYTKDVLGYKSVVRVLNFYATVRECLEDPDMMFYLVPQVFPKTIVEHQGASISRRFETFQPTKDLPYADY